MSNEKILSSLVCDVLDLTKLKSGKFKKNSQVLDLKQTINEIIMVLKYKAQQMGINIVQKYLNFEKNNKDNEF